MSCCPANCRPGATARELDALTQNCPGLRRDYIDFLSTCNGLEGEIGETYVVLWSTTDLIELDEACAVSEFGPGLLLVGTDGGDDGFGIDTRNEHAPFVQVPLTGVSWEQAGVISTDFPGFLEYLKVSPSNGRM
jgi:hypothetical protein